jgi:hypothetical protein
MSGKTLTGINIEVKHYNEYKLQLFLVNMLVKMNLVHLNLSLFPITFVYLI